jgi:hypothetical protein
MKKPKLDKQNIVSFIGENCIYGGVSIYAKTLKKFELELSEQKQFVWLNKLIINTFE